MEDELLDIPDDELMLTTVDNPYNPKQHYDKWRKWDIDNLYNTEAYLERVANIPYDVEDVATITKLTVEAMISIAEDDALGMYRLV